MGGQQLPLLLPFEGFLTWPLDVETQVDATDSQQEEQKSEQGTKATENIRYGQNISESGMGGMTTEAQGNANQGGKLKLP